MGMGLTSMFSLPAPVPGSDGRHSFGEQEQQPNLPPARAHTTSALPVVRPMLSMLHTPSELLRPPLHQASMPAATAVGVSPFQGAAGAAADAVASPPSGAASGRLSSRSLTNMVSSPDAASPELRPKQLRDSDGRPVQRLAFLQSGTGAGPGLTTAQLMVMLGKQVRASAVNPAMLSRPRATTC